MSPRAIARATAFAFFAAAPALAAWTLAAPWGHLDGAHIGASPQWILAHGMHFAAGLLLVFAVAGVAVQRLRGADRFETIATGVALLGAGLFACTGAFNTFIWPLVAVHAPQMVEADGAFFKPPLPLVLVASGAFSVGLVLLAVALRRARILSLAGTIAMAAGAALMLVPPPPAAATPWIIIALSGPVAGLGAAWIGWSIRAGASREAAAAASPAGARVAPA